VAAGLIGAALLVFVIQNRKTARVKWLVFEVKAPFWLLILVIVAASMVAGQFIGVALHRARMRRRH
jgi:uncharacterized integral membrane protein